MKTDIKKNIENLFSKRSSAQVFLGSFREISPCKDTWRSFVIIIFLLIIPSYLIGFSEKTVEFFIDSIDILNTIILALFAVVFTGYAFFQALVNKEFLLRLLSNEGNSSGKSKLQESNEYFANIMMLDVFAIIINAFLLITFKCLPEDFCLFDDLWTNNSLSALLIWIYFSLMFLIIWEMKSFVYNAFQLFNAHAGAKAIALLKDNKKEE